MSGYYSEKLSAERLRLCYEIAPPRVQRYLAAEVRFVIERTKPTDVVLELGCGYGRVVRELARVARRVIGIDTARDSLELARQTTEPGAPGEFHEMDAAHLTFPDDSFDLVVCVQNGISAFQVDPSQLLAEAVRVARPGGRVLFSSYAERFWEARLEWFRLQSEHGLLGEIDYAATGNGVIVCRDGFRATTFTPQDFRDLCAQLGLEPIITEVDGSSVFCEIVAGPPRREDHGYSSVGPSSL